MLQVICPTCRSQLRLAAIPAGGMVRCSACQTALRVAAPKAGPVAAPPPQEERAPSAPEPPSAPKPDSKPAAGRRPAPRQAPEEDAAELESLTDQSSFQRHEGDAPWQWQPRDVEERPRRQSAQRERPRGAEREPSGGVGSLLPAALWAGLGFGVLFVVYGFDLINHASTHPRLPFGDEFLSGLFGDQNFSMKSPRWEMVKGMAIAVEGVLLWLLLACSIGLLMRRSWGRSLAFGVALGGGGYFVLHALVVLGFLPFLGFGPGNESTVILCHAAWYLGMAGCFWLLFLLVRGESRREAIRQAEEERDARAGGDRPRVPLRGAILALGILVLLRSAALGLGVLLLLGGWLFAGPDSQMGAFLRLQDDRMPGYSVVMIGHAVIEGFLAGLGLGLGVALLGRWKSVRLPAVLWGWSILAIGFLPLLYLFLRVPDDQADWWRGVMGGDSIVAGGLLGHPGIQFRSYAWSAVVSASLAVGLIWTMRHRRISEAFRSPGVSAHPRDDE